ncbi:hypothetical protein SFRURICE_013673 [Spodoptera frugiperda]|nr:hypothetical protein SFRURICE_013673 [Spodoptera frugiperda]
MKYCAYKLINQFNTVWISIGEAALRISDGVNDGVGEAVGDAVGDGVGDGVGDAVGGAVDGAARVGGEALVDGAAAHVQEDGPLGGAADVLDAVVAAFLVMLYFHRSGIRDSVFISESFKLKILIMTREPPGLKENN